MFSSSQEILTLPGSGDAILARVTACLRAEGLSVTQSFDLQTSAEPAGGCTCRMRVLLVYPQDGPPATLLLDSDARRTTLSLAGRLDEGLPEWVERLPGLLAARQP